MTLKVASALVMFIGLAHSILGERYILIRLFKGSLPKLFGSDHFTKATLRFAWHITTLAWFGFAGILWQIQPSPLMQPILMIIGWTFGLTGLVALVASKGKHLSWIVFGAIATLVFMASF